MRTNLAASILVTLLLAVSPLPFSAQQQAPAPTAEQQLLAAMHSISSHTLFDYVKELCSEKYGGRLTGTPEYNLSAEWVASVLKKWGVEPAGDNGTYFQSFPNPYTLVFPGCEAYLRMPVGTGKAKGEVRKYYRYETEFIPGGTSASGEVTAEVVYVGYGTSAPELGYDDYAGVDVRGKIVLMEREVPVSPQENPDLFKKWRPYSFHQSKLETAAAKGAKGMIYNYGPIGNPNNSYQEGFVYSHVGDAVVADIFAGTGRTHRETVEAIQKTLIPRSFATGKVMTLKNVTEHHPEGIGLNVLGILRGSDPALKNEYIIVGGHLDHLGRMWELMPGASDNASAVATTLGVAEAMAQCPVKPRRSVIFFFFGAEEQAMAGSDYYCQHPIFPLEKTGAFINLEGTGSGDELSVLAGKNFPGLYDYLVQANERYIHRKLEAREFANIARPRQDLARFMWKGVPGVTLSAEGVETPYHVTGDNLSVITPEILEDSAQLLFMAIETMAAAEKVDFRPRRN